MVFTGGGVGKAKRNMSNTQILALVGKGGVGKTTLSAAFVRVLSEEYPEAKILAIDADPAVGLAIALGVEVKQTLDDIRLEVIEAAKNGAGKEAVELLGEARFRIFDAMVEKEDFAFLAIGRPEGAGCYCAVNAYLKEVIDMVSRDFDYVIIDGEAGIEQINRRVMEKVSLLFLVSDASYKGLQVLRSIKEVAEQLVEYDRCGVVLNRVEEPEVMALTEGLGVEVLCQIPKDSAVAISDIKGQSVFEWPKDTTVLMQAGEALQKMGLLNS